MICLTDRLLAIENETPAKYEWLWGGLTTEEKQLYRPIIIYSDFN